MDCDQPLEIVARKAARLTREHDLHCLKEVFDHFVHFELKSVLHNNEEHLENFFYLLAVEMFCVEQVADDLAPEFRHVKRLLHQQMKVNQSAGLARV